MFVSCVFWPFMPCIVHTRMYLRFPAWAAYAVSRLGSAYLLGCRPATGNWTQVWNIRSDPPHTSGWAKYRKLAHLRCEGDRLDPDLFYTEVVRCGWGRWVKVARDGIQESTISLRFLGIILRFLRPEVPTFVFSCHACFSVRFSSFQCNYGFYGEKMYGIYIYWK